MRHRDFACNAVYYDAFNNVLIDPAGSGISGADGKTLDLVSDHDRPPYQLAKICIRYFKFMLRGFTASAQTAHAIRVTYMPCLAAMKQSGMISYIRSQLLSKEAPCDHEKILEDLRDAMHAFDAEDCWKNLIAPHVSDLLERDS